VRKGRLTKVYTDVDSTADESGERKEGEWKGGRSERD
jgi:hypothetical protein